jgi:dienelactone hydrolase
VLREGGLGTVLMDLLTEKEESADRDTGCYRFDIPLLARRVCSVATWVKQEPDLKDMSLGLFGASTGAAAALIAAARMPDSVHAVVSRGGRPDLAGLEALRHVQAPSLFIVGGEDHTVLRLNQAAMAQLPADTTSKLEIVTGAEHLFEGPGELEQVAALARDWFLKHLTPCA